jgi:hypothetical protein
MPGTDKATSDVIEPTSPAHEGAPEPSLEETFKTLADLWLRETRHQSSTTRIVNHPAYLKIVALGEPAIPLLFREMRARSGFWFYAIADITGEPCNLGGRPGDIRAAKEAWFRWGEEHGYCE